VNNGNSEQTAGVAAEVLEALGVAAVVVDETGRMAQTTSSAQQFGFLPNRPLLELELVNLITWARKSQEPQTFEGQIIVGGRPLKTWIQAKAAPIGNGYVVLTIEDRTESRRLEETRRDFVANISHELKTPIGAIALLAETLQGATDDSTAVMKFAGSLQREANRLGHIVQEIIELSRLQAAVHQPDAQLVHLNEVVNDSLDRTRILAEMKQMRVVADLSESISLQGNYDQLATATTNLIENAINYSDPNGQVGIALQTNGDFAEIVVTDSGVGIALDDQARIFERFYRVDPSRSRETGGTGLGLSIVKHIALNHGGEISVFSKPGLGSTFTMIIPLNQKDKE
jgi:two-component system sensor histidine kinase SenX3